MKTFFTRWSIRNPVITVALYIGVLILSVLNLNRYTRADDALCAESSGSGNY